MEQQTTEEKKDLSPEEQRLKECKAQIKAVLEKYNCVFDVGVLIRAGAFPEAIIKLVPKPNKILVPNMAFPPGMMPQGRA